MIHLEHINLVVDDIPAALRFYQAAFPIGVFAVAIKALGTANPVIGFILAMIINTLLLVTMVKVKTAIWLVIKLDWRILPL